MSWIREIFKEVQLSDVMRERVALADDRVEHTLAKLEASEETVKRLKERIALLEEELAKHEIATPAEPHISLSTKATELMLEMFRADRLFDRDVGAMARKLGIDRNTAKYHLDQLKNCGFARSTGANYKHHHEYWGLMPAGRKHVVEQILS